MDIAQIAVKALLITAVLANIFIGMLVYKTNEQDKLNRYFLLLSLSISGWAGANLLYQYSVGDIRYAMALLSYGVMVVTVMSFYLFIREFSSTPKNKRSNVIFYITAAAGAVSMVPGVVATGITSNGGIATQTLMLLIYGVCIVVPLVAGLKTLFGRYRNAEYEDRVKIRIIFLGIGIAILVGFFCNLILPFYDNYTLVEIGPTGTLFLVIFTAYAIVRHRLFDVRMYVIRFAAFTVASVFMAVLYVAPMLYLFGLVVGLKMDAIGFAMTVTTVSLAAVYYERLRQKFKEATGRIFYQDSYDSAKLLSKLNHGLIGTTNIEKMLENTSQLLYSSISPENCFYALDDTSGDGYRMIGYLGDHDADTQQLLRRIRDKPGDVIVIQDLNTTSVTRKEAMDLDIAVVVKLKKKTAERSTLLGFMVLGVKKSGGMYDSQDVQVLNAGASTLTIAIENALQYEEIRQFNKTLQGRVEDATSQLRETNNKLKQLDEAKDEFISMASHQLRTPLTSIKGYVSMLLDGDLGEIKPQQRKALEEAFNSSQRMVYLIGDFLNLSRIQTGRFEIEDTSVLLPRIIKEEIAQLRASAESRHVKLFYEAPKDFPTVIVDETKIRQVMMNFIDNAIYYSRPEGGEIHVALMAHRDTIEFRVKDNGIGVPAHDRHSLFTKFYRAGNARKVRPDGTGIGLYMAKKVVVAHGGALIFDSTEGVGSTFGFTIPIRLPEPQ